MIFAYLKRVSLNDRYFQFHTIAMISSSTAGLDLSACLVELGMLALEQNCPQLALPLLSASQPLIVGQLGLRMRSLLALAHAYSAVGQKERALVAYQDCLASAIEASDLRYQVKALVSLASLYHSQNDNCQARTSNSK